MESDYIIQITCNQSLLSSEYRCIRNKDWNETSCTGFFKWLDTKCENIGSFIFSFDIRQLLKGFIWCNIGFKRSSSVFQSKVNAEPLRENYSAMKRNHCYILKNKKRVTVHNIYTIITNNNKKKKPSAHFHEWITC